MKRSVSALIGILWIFGVLAVPVTAEDALLGKAASLKPQSGDGDDLKTAFNESVDNVRLMVLLSPT